MQNKFRPKYLNLWILGPKMPINAKASILHRISGFILFISIPFILYILHKSLVSPSFYAAFYGVMANPMIKLIYLALIWAFMFHMCAGIRFLFLDIDKGTKIKTAQMTARLAIIISIILTIILGILIW